ncbi:vomeronasal type-2 receptor 26-like, partial [Pleurodeles waltl]
FVPGRSSRNHLRTLFHAIWAARDTREEALALSLDAEKVFDRIEWWYLFEILKRFGASFENLLQLLVFIYAVEEINRNPVLLPNLTLGYHIFDSCDSEMKALQSTLSIMSQQNEAVPNYRCQSEGALVGFIGDLSSSTTYSMAQLLALYKYPQISYGAQDPVLSDRLRFPSFYRTVPSELSFFIGVAQLLRHFGWTWVGILTTDDDSGELALRELREVIGQVGGCIDFFHMIPPYLSSADPLTLERVIEDVRTSTAQVIILYCSSINAIHYFSITEWKTLPPKTWILSMAISNFFEYEFIVDLFHGSLSFLIQNEEIKGFKDFLHEVTPSKFPSDTALETLWEMNFRCLLMDKKNINETDDPSDLYCSGKETFEMLKGYKNINYSQINSIHTAAYLLTHALHNMYSSEPRPGSGGAAWSSMKEQKLWKRSQVSNVKESIHLTQGDSELVNRFLQKIHFKTSSGHDIFFDDKGQVPAKYDILNWAYKSYLVLKVIKVGHLDLTAQPGQQLIINESAITWHVSGDQKNQASRSVCSESCLPGSRKAPREGKPVCCFYCVPCADGEFSNRTDMENCMQCPEDQWPNAKKDGCNKRVIVFLSYSDTLGVMLFTVAIIFSAVTVVVLGIFLRHRDTPIVKANNRDLSYTLLTALILAFLCSLLFIGRPATWTCLIQQAAFGIIFTVAVSCVLAKTITVVIAFNATRPGSRLSRWLGSRVSGSIVLFCTLGEVTICLSWLLTAPPHPGTDTQSETGKMILQCDQGSVTAFYSVIGYMGLLASASFIVAFLARNLPDKFNEAKLITFSMLVFCSVWVSFFPAYISTKGKYMVAVEIFAILASSAGLLGCIFIPKCYIILFRQDINTRERLTLHNH